MRLSRHDLTPLVAAAQALVAPELVHSLPFQRLARGALSYEGVSVELLTFKLAFERALWQSGLPVFACELQADAVRFCRFPVGAELNAHEWSIVLELGLEVARQVDVAMDVVPPWWHVASAD